MSARSRRAAATITGTVLLLLTFAAPAAADTGDGGPWLELALEDSHGIAWHQFNLDIYFGGVRESTDGQQLWAGLQSFFWGTYHFLIGMLIYIADWAMSLEWALWLTNPLSTIGEILEGQFDQLDIRALVLTLLAVVVGFWMFRGRIGTGLGNLAIGLLILGMVGGFLATPIAMVADPEDGLVYQARDAGYEIAVTISGTGSEGPMAWTPEQARELSRQQSTPQYRAEQVSQARQALNTAMVDALIRLPHQVVNYGEVIDGTACEAVYDAALVDESRRPHDVINDAPECPQHLYDYAHHPTVMSTVLTWSVVPVAAFFFLVTMLLLLLLAGVVISTLWSGIQIIWNGILAALPGQSRAGLVKNLAGMVGGFVLIAGLVVAWIGWLSVVQSIMATDSEQIPFIVRMWFFNILILLGGVMLIVFRPRVRKRLKAIAERLAQAGASNTRQSAKGPAVLEKAKSAAVRSATAHVSRVAANRPHVTDSTPRPEALSKSNAGAPGPDNDAPAAPSTSPSKSPADSPSSRPVSTGESKPGAGAPSAEVEDTVPADDRRELDPHERADKFRRRLKTTGNVAFHVGLATLSGGTSLVAKGAHVAWKAKKAHDTTKAMREHLAERRSAADQQEPRPKFIERRTPAPSPKPRTPAPERKPKEATKPADRDQALEKFLERTNASDDTSRYDPTKRARRLRDRVGSRP